MIVLAIVSGTTYLAVTAGKDSLPSANKNTQAEENPAPPPAGQSAGAYIPYKDGIIAETAGTKLLFFYAPWCPQCRALEADIKAGHIPENVSIIKVDYDSSQTLRKAYGVTIQTTVVRVDDDGKLVEKFVAYDDPSLEAVVAELL